jgi:hypothetical protein
VLTANSQLPVWNIKNLRHDGALFIIINESMSGNDLATVKFLMAEVVQFDNPPLYERLYAGKCVVKCVVEVLNGPTDKLSFGIAPWPGNIRIQAPTSAEIPDPAFSALISHRNGIELQRMGAGDVPEIILGHPDHDGTGTDTSVSHDTVISVP